MSVCRVSSSMRPFNSPSCAFTLRISRMVWFMAFILSRQLITKSYWACKSAGVASLRGSCKMVKGTVCSVPSAARVTVYSPGSTKGPSVNTNHKIMPFISSTPSVRRFQIKRLAPAFGCQRFFLSAALLLKVRTVLPLASLKIRR